MLNLTHVRSFLTVIEARSIRAGARTVGLSPSTVLEHLRQLEASLGSVLLVRQAGNPHLTPAGARFLPLARALVATALRAADLIQRPHLAVAASSNIGTYLLHPRIAAFERDARVEVRVWIGSNMQAAARLKSGEADLAVLEAWEDTDGFDVTCWSAETLKVIVAPDHRWAGKTSIDREDLTRELILTGEPGTGTGRILREALGSVVARLHYLDGLGSTEGVKRAVRAGRGISIVMESAIQDELLNRTLVALDVDGTSLEKRLLIVRSSHLPPTASASRFAECLLEGPNSSSGPPVSPNAGRPL
ncbi:LysR substrate-binding domain-containing protein [Rhodopseudomonas palustris]|uniref:LysR substrate-binding domain-containing protein n=1 Tax=Rhodopseudomonas palustris TaxID=1076 RepID=UPI002ACEDAFC|nr:LysR substrate-binding domain-containing protein [Rhodopseudomonas palustris]WQH01324.1 LysR substrate-binding domain-containing protein [Rhodopseudomonas palustris]